MKNPRGKIIFFLSIWVILLGFILIVTGFREEKKIRRNSLALLFNLSLESKNSLRPIIEESQNQTESLITQYDEAQLKWMVKNKAEILEDFLFERESELRFLVASKALINPTGGKKFLTNHFGFVKNDLSDFFYFDIDKDSWLIKSQHKKSDIKVKKLLPYFSEMSLINLKGQEEWKVVALESERLFRKRRDFSQISTTYLENENILDEIKMMSPGEVKIFPMIGEYRPTSLLGHYSKSIASQIGVPFKPTEDAFSGIENPVGKRFQGYWRMVAPIMDSNNEKIINYLSLTLNHEHIINIIEDGSTKIELLNDQKKEVNLSDMTEMSYKDISNILIDPSLGQYFFMLSDLGEVLAHPRHTHINGIDAETKEKVAPWIDEELYNNFLNSAPTSKNLKDYLREIPPYYQQSFQKSPGLEQLNQGKIPLDCRYSNFAPQCLSWRKIFQLGVAGVFEYRDGNQETSPKVLSGGATIFRRIPIGNGGFKKVPWALLVGNNHEGELLKTEWKEKSERKWLEVFKGGPMENFLIKVKEYQKSMMERNWKMLSNFMIFLFGLIIILGIILSWISYYNSWKIKFLMKGVSEYQLGHFDYVIPQLGEDEIGQLGQVMNQMAKKLQIQESKFAKEREDWQNQINQLNQMNSNLEEKENSKN
jgi:hypothetical protein